MAYQTLSDFNASQGIQVIPQAAAAAEPRIAALLLFGIFMVSCFGSFFAIQRRFGKANFAYSFAIGMLITAVAATFFSLIEGFVSNTVMVVVVALTILGSFWAFLSGD